MTMMRTTMMRTMMFFLYHDNLRLRRIISRLLLRSWKKRMRISLRIQQLMNHVRYPCWAKRRWISKWKSLEKNRLTRVSLLGRWKKRVRKPLKEAAMNLCLRYPCCGAGKIVRMILFQKSILSIISLPANSPELTDTFVRHLRARCQSLRTCNAFPQALTTHQFLLYLRYPCCAKMK